MYSRVTTTLLLTAVPSHVARAVRQQITKTLPSIYTEHYSQVTVVYGRLVGLEDILSQCSVQDGARLINELQARIDQIVKIWIN
ncbi:unnamed protein product [Enterobius vermicularis]|uniref:Secreted protein n=1 Tax=Enterobius vermicularis TaxID=51028 RepID=A0A0N4VJF8_ENTVE|nr:unnamed protein product [Enterobius vermicularis]